MKIAISILTLMILTPQFSFTQNETENGHTLILSVNELRNESGHVQFALYNKDGSIPDHDYKKFFKIASTEIVEGTATVVFNNLPTGKYAVSILHDENKNGEIDKGFILPIEGIGFSNITSIGLGNRPNFKKASFDLNADKTLEIKVIYL